MKILVLILGNLIILSIGILMRFLYKKYVLKEENITFRKLFSEKRKKTKEYDLNDFENEISNRIFGWLFVVLVAVLLWFLSSNKIL